MLREKTFLCLGLAEGPEKDLDRRKRLQWGVEQSIIREPGQRRIFPSRRGTRFLGMQTGVMMTPVSRPFLVGFVRGVYRGHRRNDPDATAGERLGRGQGGHHPDDPSPVRVFTRSTLVLRAAK